jgi:CarD family transcriptional regulator
MLFNVGDKAFYPAMGVCQIKAVESRDIAGSRQDFYVLEMVSSGASLMIPVLASLRGGIRPLINDGDIKNVYSILRTPRRLSQTTWNRRLREFNEKLSTGSVKDIAEVLRDLSSLKSSKALSHCEKDILEKALKMVVTEISAAANRESDEVYAELNQLLMPN